MDLNCVELSPSKLYRAVKKIGKRLPWRKAKVMKVNNSRDFEQYSRDVCCRTPRSVQLTAYRSVGQPSPPCSVKLVKPVSPVNPVDGQLSEESGHVIDSASVNLSASVCEQPLRFKTPLKLHPRLRSLKPSSVFPDQQQQQQPQHHQINNFSKKKLKKRSSLRVHHNSSQLDISALVSPVFKRRPSPGAAAKCHDAVMVSTPTVGYSSSDIVRKMYDVTRNIEMTQRQVDNGYPTSDISMDTTCSSHNASVFRPRQLFQRSVSRRIHDLFDDSKDRHNSSDVGVPATEKSDTTSLVIDASYSYDISFDDTTCDMGKSADISTPVKTSVVEPQAVTKSAIKRNYRACCVATESPFQPVRGADEVLKKMRTAVWEVELLK